MLVVVRKLIRPKLGEIEKITDFFLNLSDFVVKIDTFFYLSPD